jgi:hypothetical protein
MSKLLITVGCSVAIIAMNILFIHTLLTSTSTELKETKELYKVVDRYNNCDVVRYAPPNEARFHYFLNCDVTQ